MERLTEWVNSEGEVYALPNRNMPLRNNAYSQCVQKLAEYEDAEEQGLLFKMPFEIGQKIYIIVGNIAEMLVAGYEILGDSQMLITAFIETPEVLGGNLDVKDAGKKFFATREEAEAKLAEMED